MRKLRIGGPNLTVTQHTWYNRENGAQVRVDFGVLVDPADMVQEPEDYVSRGQATWVNDKDEVSAAPLVEPPLPDDEE